VARAPALHANNFDLIRLAAALQVAYMHGAWHFGTLESDRPLSSLAYLFPGVPVFFFISGFLISQSFERNPSLGDYARNRVLRIYPALIVCFVLSLAATWMCGFFAGQEIPHGQFLVWVLAQLTVGQFYNPPFINRPPIWSLNGSAWTITVELQFYLLVPLLYSCLGLLRMARLRSNLILGALILCFLVLTQLWPGTDPGFGGELGPQIPAALFVPWFYMFLVGVLFQRNAALLKSLLAGRFPYIFVAYCVLAVYAARHWQWSLKDTPNPVLFAGLALVTFSAAFSAPTLSQRLLRRNDISYGLYVYNAPVINVLLLSGVLGGHWAAGVALAVSLALGYASWILIEKPALARKRHPLYAHRTAASAG
jgi:peptidoglycan/LPS O-acetylase OafA/YrhL